MVNGGRAIWVALLDSGLRSVVFLSRALRQTARILQLKYRIPADGGRRISGRIVVDRKLFNLMQTQFNSANFCLSRRFFRTTVLVFGLFLTATTTAAAAPLDHRPKDFFLSVWEKDKRICEPVLKSLNKEYQLPGELRGWKNINLITDLLLTADLEIDWQRRPFKINGVPQELDYVFVDLANNGHSIPVVRWDFPDQTGHPNALFLPPALPVEITSGEALPSDIVRGLGADPKNVLTITPRTSEFWKRQTFPMGGMFILNILEVGGRIVLLAAGNQEAERAAMDGGGFDAFVLEYHSALDIPVICHFRGGDRK